MSLMTENKARKLLKEYMDAELNGNDSKADEVESKLSSAGWKISVGAEGYTVVRANGGLFNTDDTTTLGATPPNGQYLPPYARTQNAGSSNLPLIIGISVGGLILIIAVILGISAYKNSKNVVSR